ncbi:hypothetical protein THOM_2732, partial [Trachipleistophora hominis]
VLFHFKRSSFSRKENGAVSFPCLLSHAVFHCGCNKNGGSLHEMLLITFVLLAQCGARNAFMVSMDLTDQELEKFNASDQELRTYTAMSDPKDPAFDHLLNLPSQEQRQPLPKCAISEETERMHTDLNSMADYINDQLGLPKDAVPSINNKKAFKRLYDWLMLHFDDLALNGRIAISLEIRYFMCAYIVAFLPAQFAFFFPRALVKIIPSTDKPIIGDFVKSLKTFLDFVKANEQGELFITFSVGRSFNSKRDFDFILAIPKKIISDPLYVLQQALMFDLKAAGLEEFRARIGEDTLKRK